MTLISTLMSNIDVSSSAGAGPSRQPQKPLVKNPPVVTPGSGSNIIVNQRQASELYPPCPKWCGTDCGGSGRTPCLIALNMVESSGISWPTSRLVGRPGLYSSGTSYLLITNFRSCTLFCSSLKYHRLHPEYISQRIDSLGSSYNLRILLILCDIVS